MKILFAASEFSPIVKIGGLGDVAGSLPKHLKKEGADISVVIPLYKGIDRKKWNIKLNKKNTDLVFEGKKKKFNLWQTKINNVDIYFIENKKYISNGGVYANKDASPSDIISEAERFIFFSLAVIEVSKIIKAEIIHCNDWHTAVIPLFLKKAGSGKKTMLTIHNLQYQGVFTSKKIAKLIGNGKKTMNSLEIGIENADIITTVSPTYAKELIEGKFSFGLNKQLKERANNFHGIINGLDNDEWNPEKDKNILRYSKKSLSIKEKNKQYIEEKIFKKYEKNKPLIVSISRLANQKGIGLTLKAIPHLASLDAYIILLGEGERKYELALKKMSRKYKKSFKFINGFNEKLAHQLYAGGDMFLMPSKFEPCGLGQQIAMKYGTIPIARAVGGIKDTVKNVDIKGKTITGNGFLFEEYSLGSFLRACLIAIKLYKRKNIWQKIIENAMNNNFSWDESAKKYIELYKKLKQKKQLT